LPVLSNRLKQAITSKGITQRQLAVLCDTTEVSVSRWVRGKRIPDAEMLYKLCKALNVSADYLLGLSDEQRNNIGELKAELLEKIRKVLE